MITPDDLEREADSVANIYSALEDKIFNQIIKTVRTTRFDKVDKDNVLAWQAEQLSKMGVLNDATIKLLAKYAGETTEQIKQLIRVNGIQIVDELDQELQRMTQRSVPLSPEIDQITDSLISQTFEDLNNNINQTMITTNYTENSVMRAYQAIVKQSTIETLVGLKTHEKAVKDNVYKLVDEGIKSDFKDKAGREWSQEAYSRMVLRTTSHRTYNDLRMQRMDDFDVVTVLMSSHPASREACAPIQGQVVNRVPMSDPRADKNYDSIYNHGYGDPSGTQGINCHHILWPFIPGVNTNNQPQYDPKEAMENGKLQQEQRKLERAIRKQKKRLMVADELDDEIMKSRCKDAIRLKQKQLRELVNKHDFLNRDYAREQVQSQQESIRNEVKETVANRKVKSTTEYHKFKDILGDKAPESVEAYEDLKYNNVKKFNRLKDNVYVKSKLKSGEWGSTINPEKQAPHMKATMKPGKSYFDDDVDTQALFDKYAGTGIVETNRHGRTNKEKIMTNSIIGTDFRSGEKVKGFKIHHSPKRTHIVPWKGDS